MELTLMCSRGGCSGCCCGGKRLIVLRQVCEYRQPIGHLVRGHIGGIQQCGNAQLRLCNTERQLVVVEDVGGVKFVEITRWCGNEENLS